MAALTLACQLAFAAPTSFRREIVNNDFSHMGSGAPSSDAASSIRSALDYSGPVKYSADDHKRAAGIETASCKPRSC